MLFRSLFGGDAELSKWLRQQGCAVVSVDYPYGPHCDLTRTAVYNELKGWILAGICWGVFAGTPCETYSRARRAPPHSSFPGPLRSTEQPRGRDGLSTAEQKKVNVANLVSDRTANLLRIAEERGLSGGEENPATSILWCTRQRRRQVDLVQFQDHTLEIGRAHV